MERGSCQTTNQKVSAGTVQMNYRPVSNLGFISKIGGKVTLQQFTEHCNKSNLLPEYQSVYRKHHSCKTSLVKLVNDILWGMENQSVTAVGLLDLSAAFNTVNHDLLLEVLEMQFGITGWGRQWHHNYLKPRKFKVEIGQEKYKTRQLDLCVPQGGIQGAFLFITCASALDDEIDNLIPNRFADDHSVRKMFKVTRLDHKDK